MEAGSYELPKKRGSPCQHDIMFVAGSLWGYTRLMAVVMRLVVDRFVIACVAGPRWVWQGLSCQDLW